MKTPTIFMFIFFSTCIYMARVNNAAILRNKSSIYFAAFFLLGNIVGNKMEI